MDDDDKTHSEVVSLRGSEGALSAMRENDVVVVPNEKEWKIKDNVNDYPFAILLFPKKNNLYYRRSLVEIDGDVGRLKKAKEEEFVILANDNICQNEICIEISFKKKLLEQITLFSKEENIDPETIKLAVCWINYVEDKSNKGKVNNQEHLEEINNLQNNFDKLERLKKELRELQTNIEIPPK